MQPTERILREYRESLSLALADILRYWKTFAPDEQHGGFMGRIDPDNRPDFSAAKGSVLNARILWFCSAAYRMKADQTDLDMAGRAFDYIKAHFIDDEFGGVYWLVNPDGSAADTRKQSYAIAFTIYGLSEYHLASKNEAARLMAMKLYEDLVAHSYDPGKGGYFEAFSREWGRIEDLRLSEKDANEKKTMNTHLHVLEAFTTLYRIWPDAQLKDNIAALIDTFMMHILHPKTGSLILFFDENWTGKSDVVSFGHDIEASWLLLEAAEVIADPDLIEKVKAIAVRMAKVSEKGMDSDGGLFYEYNPITKHLVTEKHWWVQAEAMVGFYNAWQLSNEDHFLSLSLKNWKFVQRNILDRINGEWFWGVTESGAVMPGEDKVGIWKCPYHNGRACMELIKRIGHYLP